MSHSVFLLPSNRGSSLRFHRAAFFAVVSRWIAGGILAACLGGCATGDYAYVATISGGERVRIPLVKGSPEMSKADGIQVLQTSGAVNHELKKFGYVFAFSDQHAEALTSVIVEDVSDESAVRLVEDLEPKLIEKRWTGVSRPFAAYDPAGKWILHVNDTFRVFRFTITRADGKKIVIHQGSRVPAWAKAGIRSALGEKP
jgi:hypothetical protein